MSLNPEVKHCQAEMHYRSLDACRLVTNVFVYSMKTIGDNFILMLRATAAAKNLLSAGEIRFGETLLKVVKPQSDAVLPPGNVPSKKIQLLISGIAKTVSTPILKAFLESSKVGGGSIENMIHEPGQDTAIVTFEDPEGNIHLEKIPLSCLIFYQLYQTL